MSQLGDTSISWVEARDATYHPTNPYSTELSDRICHAEVEKTLMYSENHKTLLREIQDCK